MGNSKITLRKQLRRGRRVIRGIKRTKPIYVLIKIQAHPERLQGELVPWVIIYGKAGVFSAKYS